MTAITSLVNSIEIRHYTNFYKIISVFSGNFLNEDHHINPHIKEQTEDYYKFNITFNVYSPF